MAVKANWIHLSVLISHFINHIIYSSWTTLKMTINRILSVNKQQIFWWQNQSVSYLIFLFKQTAYILNVQVWFSLIQFAKIFVTVIIQKTHNCDIIAIDQGSPHLQIIGMITPSESIREKWRHFRETSNKFIETCFCKNVLFLHIIFTKFAKPLRLVWWACRFFVWIQFYMSVFCCYLCNKCTVYDD